MGSKFEDKEDNKKVIEQLTNELIETDEGNGFTREEQEEYATFIVNDSKYRRHIMIGVELD